MRFPPSLKSLLVLALLSISGCQPEADQPASAPEPLSPVATEIPLRVWIAAPLSDSQTLLRQWLSHSEQPLEIRTLSVAELLRQERCACDVLIYPARLIGELVHRDWIARLPTSLRIEGSSAAAGATSMSKEDHSSEIAALPAAWRAQADYAGQPLALSLGLSLPVFVASDSLAKELVNTEEVLPEMLDWDTVLKRLGLAASQPPALNLDAAEVDRDALVDRFLAIVASVSSRDPAYGLLFDLQTMRSRLGEPEFIRAAEILAGLASQDANAILGDHSHAWTWAATHEEPALAISVGVMLDSSAAEAKSGAILRIEDAPPTTSVDADASLGSAELVQRPSVSGWNTGSGLIVSLAAECRQTNQAAAFLKWLGADGTRSTLARVLPGVEGSARSSADTLAWKARQTSASLLAGNSLAYEPRLPAAVQYRAALAEELLDFLSGAQTAQAALAETDRRWLAVSNSVDGNQRLQYEQSLGLEF